MEDEFEIHPDVLRRHALSIDQTGDRIYQAWRAGSWVRTSNDAYGLMFGWFAQRLNPTQEDLIGSMRQAMPNQGPTP